MKACSYTDLIRAAWLWLKRNLTPAKRPMLRCRCASQGCYSCEVHRFAVPEVLTPPYLIEDTDEVFTPESMYGEES